MMDDEGDSDSDGADFLTFAWDVNYEDAPKNNEEGEIIIRNHADLVDEIARLEIDEADGAGGGDLRSAVQQIGSAFPCQLLRDDDVHKGCMICNIIDMHRKNDSVLHYMGTMAQCRGAGGDALREAGAIDVLLGNLWRLIVPLHILNEKYPTVSLLPPMCLESNESNGVLIESGDLCDNHLHLRINNPDVGDFARTELHMSALGLATSCLGALRDLSCGSALNRAAVLAWTPPSVETLFGARAVKNGVQLLSAYIQRYDRCRWEQILSLGPAINGNANEVASSPQTERGEKELRLLTNALGAVRNTSHSTPDVCQEFFNIGLVDCLVWRLMPDVMVVGRESKIHVASSLPDSGSPWREACFRSAVSLINIAEKCSDAAHQLGSNRQLIYLLIEAWGGASAVALEPANSTSARGLPLLHLGLAAILNAAGNGALEGGLDDVMTQVLEKEKVRKEAAQRQEEERKIRMAKQIGRMKNAAARK